MTITIITSDHPHFPAGAQAAVQVARGRIAQLGIYAVRSETEAGDRVSLRTGTGYTFVVSAEEYDRLCGGPCETQSIDGGAERAAWVSELQAKAR
jgi:hypothetical protein